MRITGGTLGGRRLESPDDARVRPTSDRTRQAIFNILDHKDFGFPFMLEGARVVDLFAGTGAMGLEAVSRGARYCLFVDMVRPTPFPGIMRAVISGIRRLTQSFKFIYYKNWKVLDR